MSMIREIKHLKLNVLEQNQYEALTPLQDEFYVTPDYTNLPLLTPQWFDYKVSDIQWLNSSDFSYHDGNAYSKIYDHLVKDISGKSLTTEVIDGVTISFYRADDGHKICLPDMETNLTNLYTKVGIAWYYVLNTSTKAFKLPRTRFGFNGVRDTVGNYIKPALPKPEIVFRTDSTSTSDTDLVTKYGNDGYTSSTPSTTAGVDEYVVRSYSTNLSDTQKWIDLYDKLGIYDFSNTTVQVPATQMYLYFFAGNFTTTALENTAGINAETLSRKMDNDLGNLPPNIDFIVESHTTETDYYRIYKSGLIVQGQLNMKPSSNPQIITFLKPFKDTNYHIYLNVCDTSPTDSALTVGSWNDKTTTGFKIYEGYNGASQTMPINWTAIGF